MNKRYVLITHYLKTTSAHLRVAIPSLLLCTAFLILFAYATYASPIMQDVPPPTLTPTPVPTTPTASPLVSPTASPPLPPPPLPSPADDDDGQDVPFSPATPTITPMPALPPPPQSSANDNGGTAADFFCGEGSAAISGTVVDPDGNPVMGVNVTLGWTPVNDPNVPSAPAPTQFCGNISTNANGEFLVENIAAGEYMLIGSPLGVGGGQLSTSESFSITVAEAESVQLEQPIQLGYAQAFVEVIFLNGGVDWVEGNIILEARSEEGECSADLHVDPSPYSPHLYQRSISQNGFASFDNIESGAYCMHANVYATNNGGGSSMTLWVAPAPVQINIPADAQLLDLGQIEFSMPPKRIVGTVVDESGIGVSNVSVQGTGHSVAPMGGWVRAVTDESGRFEFTVAGQSWTINMNVNDEIGSSNDSQRSVTFSDDETVEEQSIQFTITRTNSSITGRLLNPDGTPIASDDLADAIYIVALRENVRPSLGETDAAGIFTMPLQPGTYRVMVSVNPHKLHGIFSPAEVEVVVEENMTVDLGDILLRGPQVTAQVVDLDGVTPQRATYRVSSPTDWDDDGVVTCAEEQPEVSPLPIPAPPVPNADPSVEYPDSDVVYPDTYEPTYRAYGTTDENGWLQIGGLATGDYCLMLEFSTESGGYNAPLETTFSIVDENALFDLGTLVRKALSKHAVGSITQADGTAVVGMKVSATLQSNSQAGWVQTTTDETGAFAFDLGPGRWQIAIDLRSPSIPPTADGIFYSVAQQWFTDEANAMVRFERDDSEEMQNVNFVVAQTNATIVGRLLKPDGTPATGFNGQVRAFSEQFEDAWTNTSIDPETAEFELDIIGGEWQIAYHLYGFHYGNSSDYIGSIAPMAITVENGSVTQQDFMLTAYDATIRGTVLYPDSSPVSYGYAQIRSVGDETGHGTIHRGAKIVKGEFEVKVLSGLEYEIGVDLHYYTGTTGDYMQPNKERITPAADSTTDLVMQFIEPDSTIVGTVYQSETGDPTRHARVMAWSLGGQYRYVDTDANGAFSLAVQSGATWYISAWWWSQDDGYMSYETDGEIEVVLAEAGERTQNLTVVVQDYSLPQAITETFDSGIAQSITLDDGTMIEIPAAAVPVEDTDGHDVRVEIAPLTAGLPGSYATDAVDYGYDIQIFNNHTGEEVTAALNHDIIVTYQYEDSALAEMSADETTLAPAIRTTNSDAWDTAENFTVNPEKNELRLSISQAAEAAITVRPNRQPQQNHFSFMPLAFD